MHLNNPYQNFSCVLTLTGHESFIKELVISSNNSTLFSGSMDSTIKVWNLRTGQQLRTLKGHSRGVTSIALAPNEQVLVSASEDCTVKTWNLRNGENIRTLMGHSKCVYSVAISRDCRIIASGSWDNTIMLWDWNTGQHIGTLEGYTDTVCALAFSPNGKSLVSGSRPDGIVKVWDLVSFLETKSCRSKPINDEVHLPINSLVITQDSKQILGACDTAIVVWDLSTGKYCGAFMGENMNCWGVSSHESSIYSLAISLDNSVVVSGSQDSNKHIAIWDLQTAKEIHKLVDEQNGTVFAVAISPDKQTIVSGNKKTISVWRARD